MQECDFAGQVDGDQGGGIKHEEKGYPRNKKKRLALDYDAGVYLEGKWTSTCVL